MKISGKKAKEMIMDIVAEVDYDISKELFDYPETEEEIEENFAPLLRMVEKYIEIEE